MIDMLFSCMMESVIITTHDNTWYIIIICMYTHTSTVAVVLLFRVCPRLLSTSTNIRPSMLIWRPHLRPLWSCTSTQWKRWVTYGRSWPKRGGRESGDLRLKTNLLPGFLKFRMIRWVVFWVERISTWIIHSYLLVLNLLWLWWWTFQAKQYRKDAWVLDPTLSDEIRWVIHSFWKKMKKQSSVFFPITCHVSVQVSCMGMGTQNILESGLKLVFSRDHCGNFRRHSQKFHTIAASKWQV